MSSTESRGNRLFSTVGSAGRSQTLSAAGVLLFAALWKAGAQFAGAEVILPGPLTVLRTFGKVILSESFLPALTNTALRGGSAFLASALTALILGVAAGLSDAVRDILRPLVIIIKSTPVMSFILLALIWFPSGFVPIFVAVLMAFPIIYENVQIGLRAVDGRLLEMARVYRISKFNILRRILLPGIFSYFLAASKTAFGIIWKAVIAAEILSRPSAAVGSEMYEAKIYIETASVLAWTLVAVLLSAASDILLQAASGTVRGVRRGGMSI